MEIALQDQVNAGPARPGVTLHWRDGVPMRLQDLIQERVRIEHERRVARPLVDGAEDAALDALVATALEGFRRNAYVVLVDERQVMELHDEIRIAAGTSITFIRLLPLRSG